MMQPLTVIDGNEKEVYRLRKTPDNSSKKDNVVGEITYASHGVHVLETLDNGWTLVEASMPVLTICMLCWLQQTAITSTPLTP
jgi:hypothetical protein